VEGKLGAATRMVLAAGGVLLEMGLVVGSLLVVADDVGLVVLGIVDGDEPRVCAMFGLMKGGEFPSSSELIRGKTSRKVPSFDEGNGETSGGDDDILLFQKLFF
jgi:hypothetical protein